MKVVIVGGGWAGCAAAFAAHMAGARVILIEKTDLLLGTGLVGGIMRNNGRYTATEELVYLGGKEFIGLVDSVTRHRDIDFPGHKHASFYDVTKIEALIKEKLLHFGVDLKFKTLISDVVKEQANTDTITAVMTKNGDKIAGDIFIDCTGTAGPMNNCIKYGQGCAMCTLRCPTFGPRISITEKAGIDEIKVGCGNIEYVAMSGSCKIDKNSLAPFLIKELNDKGVIIIPLPKKMQKREMLSKKACQQYALEEYIKNLIILDTGHAKLMTPFFPLESLRQLQGFADARFTDPYAGGQGNSIRYMAIAPCDDSLKVVGLKNLFCAGEKAGPMVGHTEAIVSGMLAGHNAVRAGLNIKLLEIPVELAIGDIIAFMHREMKTEEGLKRKYTFSGSIYFNRMIEKGLYTTDIPEIKKRVLKTGLARVFSRQLF